MQLCELFDGTYNNKITRLSAKFILCYHLACRANFACLCVQSWSDYIYLMLSPSFENCFTLTNLSPKDWGDVFQFVVELKWKLSIKNVSVKLARSIVNYMFIIYFISSLPYYSTWCTRFFEDFLGYAASEEVLSSLPPISTQFSTFRFYEIHLLDNFKYDVLITWFDNTWYSCFKDRT